MAQFFLSSENFDTGNSIRLFSLILNISSGQVEIPYLHVLIGETEQSIVNPSSAKTCSAHRHFEVMEKKGERCVTTFFPIRFSIIFFVLRISSLNSCSV